MKMSRGLNKTQQTQKSKSSKRDSIASKGVSYRKKSRRERHELPPTILVNIWLLICLCFAHTAIADKVFIGISYIAMGLFGLATLCDSILFLYVSYKRYNKPVLEPQMGSLKLDPYLKETIQIWCLFESLRDSRTKRGMLAAITQYLQAHVKESLPLYLYRTLMRVDYINDWSSDSGQLRVEEMLNEAFGDHVMQEVDQELMLDPQGGDDSTWYQAADSAFNNWKEFRSSSIAKRFTHLINVIVSAGLCSTADLTFKIGNVSLFTPIVNKKQLAASDVFEAFYETVSGFMKGGWRVFYTGEVSAFFMEDDKVSEFDKMYNQLRSWHGYALAGNLREYTDIDDNEYEAQLKKAIEFGENLLKFIKRSQTFERKYISDRMDRLRENETEFVQLRTRGGLRMAPFAISLFGQSGCGKSSLTNLTINAGLLYNGLSADKDRIATWADNDKFASSVRSHINALIFDDFANTKEDFMDFSPAYRLIQVINNIKYLAPMADVFLKGKVSLNPYFCIVSTNVEHLNAATYSNEPESVLRRLYHVKVVPKPEYCQNGILNKEKIIDKFGLTPCPDVWNLTIRSYEAQNKRNVSIAAMKPIIFQGKLMENVSVNQYLHWVQVASKKHFSEEDQYLNNQEGLPIKCTKCDRFYCDCTMLEPESGEWLSYKHRNFYQQKAEIIKSFYDRALTVTILSANNLCNRWERFDILPERFICHPRVLKTCLFFWREDIKSSLISGYSFLFAFLLLMCISVPILSVIWIILYIVSTYWFTCVTIATYKNMIRERILDLKDVVITYTQQWQFKYAIIGLGAIGVVLAFLRSKYKRLDAHTGLDPTDIDEVNERNERVNPWIIAETTSLPMSEPSKTTTSTNLAESMRTNLVGLVSDKNKTTLGFYITSNFMLIPTHFLTEHGERDISVRCYKTGEGKVGSYFRDKISQSFTINIPLTDFSLCFVTSGGSMKDFRKFLPEGNLIRSCPAKLITRDIMDTTLQAIPILFKGVTSVSHSKCTFLGSYYNLPVSTRNGMCMSPVISDAKGSTILGFHLGGKQKLGGCGILTRDQIEFALKELSTVDGVVLSASCGDLFPHMGDFPDSTFGKPILQNTDIHYKSAVNYLTEGACIDIYGSTSGKATPYSNVKPTLISEAIEEEFGVPQKWGPPKMKGPGRYPFQATLVHAAIPSLPIGSVLSKAVRSIKDTTGVIKENIPELFECSPLSRVETVSGISNVKFIDAMNFNSSPGFPLSGSKKPLLVDLDPEDYPHIGKPRTFVKEVWDEYDEIVETLTSGHRCYAIWKSCLKDEATKLTKDKVRVFQSAPLVLQLLIRKYFLPVVRIIQMNPIKYECAVGVNAEGLEWEELWHAAMSKGKDRVLAGDYSKYDVRMPAQVTIAAFDILIDIACRCNYDEDDIRIMRMLVHEVVYPIMAYNGDLIQLFGTNPSGQNLTVIINSLVNSILLRCCFFTVYEHKDFKNNCAFLTYGDDVIGTVSEECSDFNHLSYAQWLSVHDMKFTMPDKESVPTKYMTSTDVDFLKRKCVFNEDLGREVGLLAEDSIYKRLHSHLLSKELTLEMHSAQNIESSLHDWFYYGRDVFEDRAKKLRSVAQKCNIEHLCPALEVSYDKRVNRWRHKYLGETLEEDEIYSLE